jgi:hypothetical protein
VRLRATGTSFRAIARELGMSLGGVQRALRRAGLTVTTAEPVEHFEDLPDRSQWWRLCALERWRLNHHIRAPVPIHDTDGTHRLCCLAHGVDPDRSPDFGGYEAHPQAEPADDDW